MTAKSLGSDACSGCSLRPADLQHQLKQDHGQQHRGINSRSKPQNNVPKQHTYSAGVRYTHNLHTQHAHLTEWKAAVASRAAHCQAAHSQAAHGAALLAVACGCVAVTVKGFAHTVLPLTALPCWLPFAAVLLSLPRAPRTLYCRSQRCPAGCHLWLYCCLCQGFCAHLTAAHSAALLAVTCGCVAVTVKGSTHTVLPLTALPC